MMSINREEISLKNSRDILFDHKRNEEIMEELKVGPVDEKLRKYKSIWLPHVTRMKNTGSQNNSELQTKET